MIFFISIVVIIICSSILLYGAEIRTDVLKLEKYRRRVSAVQRSGALRVACSYRTVSEFAVIAVTGISISAQFFYLPGTETDL